MSLDMAASDRVCYVQCNFCNTILADNLQLQKKEESSSYEDGASKEMMTASSSKFSSSTTTTTNFPPASFHPPPQLDQQPPRIPPIRPPEKRQRVPSAYNRFIKEEIQRIKASNPNITHREAFSTAAKNWAHFPHIHFGLKREGNKQAKLDHHHHHHQHHHSTPKSNGFY